MGADLYIKSVNEKCQAKYKPLFDKACADRDAVQMRYGRDSVQVKKAQEKVSKYYNAMYAEGYFRDSYNSSNTLNLFGLSWWKDIVPMQNKKGELSPTSADKFLRMLAVHEAEFEKAIALKVQDKEWLAQNKPEEIERYFRDGAKELRDFLALAIKLKEPIYASL